MELETYLEEVDAEIREEVKELLQACVKEAYLRNVINKQRALEFIEGIVT